MNRIDWRSPSRVDLAAIYDWIAAAANPMTALRYVEKIQAKANTLAYFADRGTPRDDIMPGARTLSVGGRATIVYRHQGDVVTIMRVFHAGQRTDGKD